MPPPPTQAEFDAYAEGYDEALNKGLSLTGEGKEYYATGRVAWLRQQLDRWQSKPMSCLDFGCGTGTSAPFLRDGLGLQSYIGYDPSAESIAQARQLTDWPGAVFTAAEDEVKPESVDLAFCNGVFHHIPPEHRAAACQTVWRALRPGAFFAFWENNRWNPAVHFVMSRVPFDADAQMLFPHQARALLRQAGFEMVDTHYLFVFPALLKNLRRLEPMLSKLPLGGQYLVLARKLRGEEGI